MRQYSLSYGQMIWPATSRLLRSSIALLMRYISFVRNTELTTNPALRNTSSPLGPALVRWERPLWLYKLRRISMKPEKSIKIKEKAKSFLSKISLRSRIEFYVIVGYTLILITYVALCGGFS